MSDPGERDPLGRSALFSPPPAGLRPRSVTRGKGNGKEALYSAPAGARQWGTVVLECSSCDDVSRISWTEFVWRHFPFWLWIPWLRYSRLMSCPACERRTWLDVQFFS